MAEVTHSSGIIHNLPRARGGKGPKVWAGAIIVSDGETLDTGLSVIDAPAYMGSGAPDGATNCWVTAETISGGEITFGTGQKTTPGAAVTDATGYLVVIGSVR